MGTPARSSSSADADPQRDPHAQQPVLAAGPAPENAAATLILVHGRGGSAEDMLSIHRVLRLDTLAALAPQAAGSTWYPHSFLAPIESNQPSLGSALRRLETIVTDLLARSVPSERIALLGFSQGACLASEFVARHPRRYGALVALCGGLIGPPGTALEYQGSLDGSIAFLGAADPDPHIPFDRVLETRDVLTRMGAAVEVRRYPGMPHAINNDHLQVSRALLERWTGPRPDGAEHTDKPTRP